ncbi:hypothetical protein COMA2_90087 [Candidatus Nitrospira nitrificans]|uniref:Uncharacterized protein n=1 Tax=Candidatus Nitrospira nitrificans TaxID=1742973 RepID=A0A0S4LV73_9BACT|nr:hypothetical protein COMA2_90087 [Candidatus Nitrospira nitrificans]
MMPARPKSNQWFLELFFSHSFFFSLGTFLFRVGAPDQPSPFNRFLIHNGFLRQSNTACT